MRLHGLSYAFTDLVTGQRVTSDEDLALAPYRFVWLTAESDTDFTCTLGTPGTALRGKCARRRKCRR